jgi:hypothetical protein
MAVRALRRHEINLAHNCPSWNGSLVAELREGRPLPAVPGNEPEGSPCELARHSRGGKFATQLLSAVHRPAWDNESRTAR